MCWVHKWTTEPSQDPEQDRSQAAIAYDVAASYFERKEHRHPLMRKVLGLAPIPRLSGEIVDGDVVKG